MRPKRVPDLVTRLREEVEGEVRFDSGTRALYATDGSNYRQVPIGVVLPKSERDVARTVAACSEMGVPLLSRGGGTSLAGQCCNVAVVVDYSKYMNRIVELDPVAKTARVQPGVVLDDLRDAAEKNALTFGPDPSTHTHCTLGGMIGNNSCGAHSIMAGETSANIQELDVLTYEGERMKVGPTSDDELERILAGGGRRAEIYAALKELRDGYAEQIRKRMPQIPRRVSGYALDELLPEKGFNVARALVGTEGTCVSVLEAKVRLVDSPRGRSLLVLGYPDVYQAGDHVMEIQESGPIALEGLDDKLVNDMVKKKVHPERARLLPEGNGWLVAEFGGRNKQESDAKAEGLMRKLQAKGDAPSMRLYDDPSIEKVIWKVREAGLGATARVPGQPDTWEGWEDSSVPPHRLGEYLRALRKLFERYGYGCALYGHFGQGCVHTRIDFDLLTSEGIEKFRGFLADAAELVTSLGGSLSGEHGDGQSKAEFLPIMYGSELVEAFQKFKTIWDPAWKMNPGKVVHPYRVDQNLRLGTNYRPPKVATKFHYRDDNGSFARATLRCVGIGDCRQHKADGVMCPSYKVTREEAHSTRGRAHLLFEMLRGAGSTIRGRWRSTAVREALDLCLACKGCKSDCPMGVDMATYKAEFLYHHYKWRLRPLSAYTMGLIYWWARLVHSVPGLARVFNWIAHAPLLGRLVKRAGGISPQRELPRFADRPFKETWKSGESISERRERPRVLLWVDTFNNHFFPQTAEAAAHVLETAGYEVVIPRQSHCCGRPLYDYGMLDLAKRLLGQTLATLRPYLQDKIPIVVLEPSCLAVFRDELPGLLPDDEDGKRLTASALLLSEFLEKHALDFAIPRLSPVHARGALMQPHCHQKALIGTKADAAIFKRLGLECEMADAGCCGMAGSFGFEIAHHDLSLKVGEYALLPRIRAAQPETLIVANGFSCREQIAQATGRRPMHLAEVVALALREGRRSEELSEESEYGEEFNRVSGLGNG